MRSVLIPVTALALIGAGAFALPAISSAANASGGVYATWTTSGNGGDVSFAGSELAAMTFTAKDSTEQVAKSATMGAGTPFGERFGSSSGHAYLLSGLASGHSEGTLTFELSKAPTAGTWGFALGDVDAEDVTITATSQSGAAINTDSWFKGAFNSITGDTDQPTWDAATQTLKGSGKDTNGASAWFEPNGAIKTITLTETKVTGFPSYQIWIAADAVGSAVVDGKVSICHRTSSKTNPYNLISVSTASITGSNGHDSHTGGIYPAAGWGDIIPPFNTYPGLNWPAGQAIWEAGCTITAASAAPQSMPVVHPEVTSSTGTPSATASVHADASSSGAVASSTASVEAASNTGSPLSSPSATASQLDRPTPATIAGQATDASCENTTTYLVNGDFEEPVLPAKSYRQINESLVPGWSTTATDKKIEIWSTGYNGVNAPDGNQFAELNATQDSELYQTVDTVPGQELVWTLYHRARGAGASGDTMSVNIGPDAHAPNSTTTFTDALSAGWVLHTGTYVVPAGQTATRFGFASGATASGNKSIGNFLDHVFFTTKHCLAPEATQPPANPEPSVSPSASGTATASPSASASGTATASPSASASGTATASPSASSGASTSASATEPTPSVTVTPKPSASETGTPGQTSELSIPKTPQIPTEAKPTDVLPPAHGQAELVDGKVNYTPDPGFTGTDHVVVIVTDPTGKSSEVVIPVSVGKEQVAVNLHLPSQVTAGTTTLIAQPVLTNAGQHAAVQVDCGPLLRTKSAGDVSYCVVHHVGGKWSVTAQSGIGVRVMLTAPAKGSYLAYHQEQFFRVQP